MYISKLITNWKTLTTIQTNIENQIIINIEQIKKNLCHTKNKFE